MHIKAHLLKIQLVIEYNNKIFDMLSIFSIREIEIVENFEVIYLIL